MMSMKKGDLLEPYVIERSLSDDGGMSEVYLAYHFQASHQKVAIKVQRTEKENSLAFQELLRQEADILRRLRHPGVVRILPLHELNRRLIYIARAHNLDHQPWYFAMEYLGEKTLSDELDHIRRLPLASILHVFYELLLVVHFLHHHYQAHCDLKPQNIFLRQTPSADSISVQPVLVDFGGSTSTAKRVSRPVGTLRYCPPELVVAMNRPDTVNLQAIQPDKIDIWSLGAVLFEMLVGRPLIPDRLPQAITSSIVGGMIDYQVSNKRTEDVNALRSVDILLERMLSNEPHKRPSTDKIIIGMEKVLFRTQFG